MNLTLVKKHKNIPLPHHLQKCKKKIKTKTRLFECHIFTMKTEQQEKFVKLSSWVSLGRYTRLKNKRVLDIFTLFFIHCDVGVTKRVFINTES